jgi:Fe-S-cluster containining protein
MGCSGACCAAFPLSPSNNAGFPPMTARARLWIDQGIVDGLDILAMVLPVDHEQARDRIVAVTGDEGGHVNPEREYFRCVHWDETTRLCTNYEDRPEMCRAFPYGKQCEYGCDADWDHAPRVWDGDYA